MRYADAKKLTVGEEIQDFFGNTIVVGGVEDFEVDRVCIVADSVTGRRYDHRDLRHKPKPAAVHYFDAREGVRPFR